MAVARKRIEVEAETERKVRPVLKARPQPNLTVEDAHKSAMQHFAVTREILAR